MDDKPLKIAIMVYVEMMIKHQNCAQFDTNPNGDHRVNGDLNDNSPQSFFVTIFFVWALCGNHSKKNPKNQRQRQMFCVQPGGSRSFYWTLPPEWLARLSLDMAYSTAAATATPPVQRRLPSGPQVPRGLLRRGIRATDSQCLVDLKSQISWWLLSYIMYHIYIL